MDKTGLMYRNFKGRKMGAVPIFCFLSWGMVLVSPVFAFDKTVTIPSEKKEGIVLTLPAGNYKAEIAGGAVALFYPIHPAYNWFYSLCIGTDSSGGQDQPNIGTLYFEPQPKVASQTDAESAALLALEKGEEGTSLTFTLEEEKQVCFWVNDFDYSDNMGSMRARVYSK